jgi:hypothetical protein
MSKKKHNSEQIIRLLRQAEVILSQGDSISKMCKQLAISDATYYYFFKLT